MSRFVQFINKQEELDHLAPRLTLDESRKAAGYPYFDTIEVPTYQQRRVKLQYKHSPNSIIWYHIATKQMDVASGLHLLENY